jgi:hypothetical protein
MAASRTTSLRLLNAARCVAMICLGHTIAILNSSVASSSARHVPRVALRGMATASTSSEGLVELGTKHVTKGLNRLTTGILSKGEGSYVHFEDGRKALDFTTGIGVTVLGQCSPASALSSSLNICAGHCHPKVSQAAAEQCMNVVHAQVSNALAVSISPLNFRILQCSIAFHRPYLELIEQLLPIMPDKSLDSFFLWNSGSEAVEAAIKMARMITGRQNIISMQGKRKLTLHDITYVMTCLVRRELPRPHNGCRVHHAYQDRLRRGHATAHAGIFWYTVPVLAPAWLAAVDIRGGAFEALALSA